MNDTRTRPRTRGVAFAAVPALATALLVALGAAQRSGDAVPPYRVEEVLVSSRRGTCRDRLPICGCPRRAGTTPAVWHNCGFYDEPIPPETAVHSMEHGAVWISYEFDLSASQQAELRRIAEEQSFVLASPLVDLPAPVVATAWGRQLQLEEPSDPRLDRFLVDYRLGPQTLEPGAPCSGGVGEPAARRCKRRSRRPPW